MSKIFERLRRVIVERLGVEADQVVPAANFTKDLNADSLEIIELAMSIEEEFSSSLHKVEIPDEDLEKMTIVQDAVDYLRDLGVDDD